MLLPWILCGLMAVCLLGMVIYHHLSVQELIARNERLARQVGVLARKLQAARDWAELMRFPALTKLVADKPETDKP